MKIHEYQAKEVLRKFGIRTPKGGPAFSVEEALEVAKSLGGPVWVVKAQIHAGGRGKGGGVKLARSLDEVRQHASAILGMRLVTHQTGPEGQIVKRLLIEEGADIKHEYYVSILPDRATQKVAVLASSVSRPSQASSIHSAGSPFVVAIIKLNAGQLGRAVNPNGHALPSLSMMQFTAM